MEEINHDPNFSNVSGTPHNLTPNHNSEVNNGLNNSSSIEHTNTSNNPSVNTQPTNQNTQSISGKRHDAGQIVLQWLTYAFWGWTVLGLSVLSTMVIANFIAKSEAGSFTPYGIAAVLVLLPVAYLCDRFYSKKEIRKKQGAEMLVMVVHAVIFALFGIGSVIVSVISIIQMFTSGTISATSQVTLFSSMLVGIFYGLTFLRTLNPQAVAWIQRWYKLFMLVTVGIIASLGIIGPVALERKTRNDRLIVSTLSDIQRSISDFTRKNNRLPSSLDELSLDRSGEQLVADNLITYKPHTSQTTYSNTLTNRTSSVNGGLRPSISYRYELCANYTAATPSNDSYYISQRNDEYSTYVSAYSHPAGEVCYKLKTL